MCKRLRRPVAAVPRYFHTVRHLKPVQIAGRLRHRAFRPRLPCTPTPERRRPVCALVDGALRPARMLGPDTFRFLNREGRVITPVDWNNPRWPKLWLYNLHYFDDLNAENAVDRKPWHRDLIRRWITENPPLLGNGWEPYPISLRAVNWIKWDLRHQALGSDGTASLALQLRWLRRRLEHHLLGNHLLANAKALVFGGLYFQGPEAEEWLRHGLGILERELAEQILPDGGHFELSPMYHLIILEDLLDLINICRVFGQPIPDSWPSLVERMLCWAAVMRHPDDDIPFFNDAALGIAPRYEDLRAFAARLGLETVDNTSDGAWLASSGYIRLVNDDAVLFFDVAAVGPDYLPGHAHADTLSMEVSLFGQRVLVNSGTSTYAADEQRQRQRGTEAHNTVTVDGEDSSEVWAGFRVARRARVRKVRCEPGDGRAEAEHDGYRRLRGRPIHRRQVHLGARELIVTDELTGGGSHQVQAVWHLHPDVAVMPAEDGAEHDFRLQIPSPHGLRHATLTVAGPVRAAVQKATWHPEFGKSVSNQRVVFRYEGTLPVALQTHLKW